MNYLAQGIAQGAQIGAQAYDARKRREQEEALEKARRELQLEVQAKQLAAEKALQNDRLVHDASMQFERQKWQGAENATDRGWRTNERLGGETFTGSQNNLNRTMTKEENAADRALRQQLQKDQLAQAESQFSQTLPLHAAETALKGASFAASQNPDSPENKLRSAQAKYYSGRSISDDEMTGGGPAFKTKEDVVAAYKAKKLTYEEAANLLNKRFNVPMPPKQ